MPPCDRCDLELLVSSAAFLISWINTSLGRELREINDQFPLRSSLWQHLWKSCPLKGRPFNISARADWVSKVQPMKQASSQMTGYSKLDFALSFCCFPSAHCKIAFPHGYIWYILHLFPSHGSFKSLENVYGNIQKGTDTILSSRYQSQYHCVVYRPIASNSSIHLLWSKTKEGSHCLTQGTLN